MGVFRTVNELHVFEDHSRHRGDSNYVRFFRRAKRLTFLQACAVAPLFETVRFDALHKMASAFNPQKRKKMPMPLDVFRSQLGFDGEDTTRLYLEMHGVEVGPDSDGTLTVYLFRDDLRLPSARAHKLPLFHAWLDALQGHQDLGTVVNGGHIPSYVPRVPSDPFHGHYVTAWESGGESEDDGFAASGIDRHALYADEDENTSEAEMDASSEADKDAPRAPPPKREKPGFGLAPPRAASTATGSVAGGQKHRVSLGPIKGVPSPAASAEAETMPSSPPPTPVAVQAERRRAAAAKVERERQQAEVKGYFFMCS
jgi:hypothetical protein